MTTARRTTNKKEHG